MNRTAATTAAAIKEAIARRDDGAAMDAWNAYVRGGPHTLRSVKSRTHALLTHGINCRGPFPALGKYT